MRARTHAHKHLTRIKVIKLICTRYIFIITCSVWYIKPNIHSKMRRKRDKNKRERNEFKKKADSYPDWRCVENISLKYACTMVCTSLHAIVNGNDTIIIVTFLFYLRREEKKGSIGSERMSENNSIRYCCWFSMQYSSLIFQPFTEKCKKECKNCKYHA